MPIQVEVLLESRSQLSLPEFRPVSGSLFRLLGVLLLVLVPFVRGWRVVVRASRSADSTSVILSYASVIARTWERNCSVSSSDTMRRRQIINSHYHQNLRPQVPAAPLQF